MESIQDSPTDSRSATRSKPAAKPQARSRVSNGRKTLPEADGRLKIARRFRDIACAILSDQSPEGESACSESRKQLIRRFAAAAVIAEQMESRLARGEQIDIQEHSLLVSTMVRVAQRIGIDRIPKDVSPSLTDLLREAESEQSA